MIPNNLGARLFRLGGGVLGIALAAMIAFPMPKADCPPNGEGRNMCVMQKQYLRASSTLAIGGAVGISLFTFMLALPGLGRRARRGELRTTTKRGDDSFVNDPVLAAACWGLRPEAGAAAPTNSRALVERDAMGRFVAPKPAVVNEEPTEIDERRAQRIARKVPVLLAGQDGTPIEAETIDVSKGGMLLSVDANKVDQNDELLFVVGTDEKSVGGRAKVVRVQSDGRVALRVDDLAAEDRRVFEQLTRPEVQRRYLRTAKPFAASVRVPRLGPFGIVATALDVSAGGVLLDRMEEIHPGETVHLELSLDDGLALLSIEGRVAWTGPGGLRGIEFTNMKPAARARLLAYAHSPARMGMVAAA